MRISAVLLLVGMLLASAAVGRGRVDGVALLAVVFVALALGRWLVEVSREHGN